MAHLVLSGICKAFGTTQALQDVGFECREGEFLCLLGPSGAGKTTTINVISGLVPPDQGRVLLDGEDITQHLPQQRNMAAAFESYALYPHLTIYDNLAFPLRAPIREERLDPRDLDQLVRELAGMLAIDELLDRYPRQLSGGQRQRVALGRALIRRPRLYLLDEPIAHLDAKLRHRMRGELRRIQMEYGISTIYSTPDQLEALSMADRIVVLNHGKVEQIGEPSEIYARPTNTFVARFVGDPPMNLVEARLEAGSLRVLTETPFSMPLPDPGRAGLERMADGRTVTVGFRPKDMQILPAGDAGAFVNGQTRGIDTLGQFSIVTLQVDDLVLKAKVAGGFLPQRGTPAGAKVDTTRLYFFDGQTGLRLPLESPMDPSS